MKRWDGDLRLQTRHSTRDKRTHRTPQSQRTRLKRLNAEPKIRLNTRATVLAGGKPSYFLIQPRFGFHMPENKKPAHSGLFISILAETEGFEPSIQV